MDNKTIQEIEGIISRIIYTNEENAYTVAEFLTLEEEIVIVGILPYIYEGESLKLYGDYVNHNEYGEQFKVETFEKSLPKTKNSITVFLSSGVIRGIRTATAKKIVEKFGDKTLDIIESEPERLAEIKGISYERALEIGELYSERKAVTDIIVFLQKYGISINLAMKISKSLGYAPISQIEKNPYILCEKIDGISFLTADSIAKAMGVEKNDMRRLKSGIKYVLCKAALNGHTYLTEEVLLKYSKNYLEVSFDEISNGLTEACKDYLIICEKALINRYFLPDLYNAENYIATKLHIINSFLNKSLYYKDAFSDIENLCNINLAANQREAISCALKNNVVVITGGPGTGKTTIIKSIIKVMEKNKKKVILTAPTGRAAKRMSEVCKKEAKTIHRLLEVNFGTRDKFVKNEENPLLCDMIIIDEMSMVDAMLFSSLLKAVKNSTRLVLVGDIDQLPSVGAGNVLKDIINSDCFPCIYLNEIYRQERESLIVKNAHGILDGKYPESGDKDSDFFIIKRLEANDTLDEIVSLIKERLPKYLYNIKEPSIQVLSPMKKTNLGTINLNNILQEQLNPKTNGKKEKRWGNYNFREGDKIIQTKNNYDIEWSCETGESGFGVFNGDTGIITKIDDANKKVSVLFYDGKCAEYDYSKLEDIDLAYAITVHKSQGCEFDAVVLPVYKGPLALMYRNLLYTAITRARNLVVLVGSNEAIKLMVDNDKETKRFTSLEGRIKG